MVAFIRCARAFGIAGLFSVAACGQSSAPAVPSSVQSARSADSRLASFRLLYISDAGVNKVYAFAADSNNPPVERTLSGLNVPGGLALDGAGDLFVANSGAGNVLEFKPRTKSPSNTLAFPAIGPFAPAFNPKGTLFVAGSQGIIEVYPPGSESPSRSIDMRKIAGSVDSMGCPAFDADGNLYVALVPSLEKPAHVYKLAGGGSSGVDLNLDIKTNSTEPGLALDSTGNIYVGNYLGIDVFPPGSHERSKSFGAFSPNLTGFFAIGNAGRVYVPRRGATDPEQINGRVLEYAAGGSQQIAHITNVLVNPLGAAISP